MTREQERVEIIVLDRGGDWELTVDLYRRLVFPGTDMVLWSKQSKTLGAIELRVPWKEHCDEVHQRKSLKSIYLMEDYAPEEESEVCTPDG